MSAIAYTVTATIADPQVAERYLAWLEDGHVDAVIAGGAHSAMIVRLDRASPGEPVRIETRYIFSTRASFDRYEREHAPALRAQGQKLFAPTTGIAFSRSVGEVQ
jgi:hypothetical protein